MNRMQQFRIVMGTTTALSLVLATWHFFCPGGVLPSVPWAVFLCHAGLCLLAWLATTNSVLRALVTPELREILHAIAEKRSDLWSGITRTKIDSHRFVEGLINAHMPEFWGYPGGFDESDLPCSLRCQLTGVIVPRQVQQFRIVVGTATALSLVLAACWYEHFFRRPGGVLPGVPWAVFLCHAGLCLLAWLATTNSALRVFMLCGIAILVGS
eukprot:m51a1_g1890 hypothetical protein (212) ;mRNA; f:732077-737424